MNGSHAQQRLARKRARNTPIPRPGRRTWASAEWEQAHPTPRLGTRVAHCDDQGTWNDAHMTGRKARPARIAVSHRSAKATAPQARYTSSLTMSGVSHQGSLALKKV